MLNRKQLAKKLAVSERTIGRWVNDRAIPYYLVNGMIRFDEARIDMWLSKKEVRPKAIQVPEYLLNKA